MKKIVAFCLSLLMLAFLNPVPSMAETVLTTERDYLPDGSYYETTLTVDNSTRSMTRKAGSKTLTYYNSKDVAQWKFILTGVFYYDGTTSHCNESHVNVQIFNSAWKEYSKKAYGEKNTANGTLTMSYSLAGSTPFTVSKTLKLTCDKNGELS